MATPIKNTKTIIQRHSKWVDRRRKLSSQAKKRSTFHRFQDRSPWSWRVSSFSLYLLPLQDTGPYASLSKCPAIVSLIRSKATRTADQATYLDTFHNGNSTDNIVTPPSKASLPSVNAIFEYWNFTVLYVVHIYIAIYYTPNNKGEISSKYSLQ